MENDCKKISRNLPAYMDGELPAGESAAVKEHLGGCRGCAGELDSLKAADSGLRALPAEEPGPFFQARVLAAVRAPGAARSPLRSFLRFPVPAMAALVAFIMINILTFAFNINAMENGPRREIARKVVVQLARPASMLNPVALARLCGECSKYMCLCMHEAGKENLCPCRDCGMKKARPGSGAGGMDHMEGK